MRSFWVLVLVLAHTVDRIGDQGPRTREEAEGPAECLLRVLLSTSRPVVT